MVTTENSVARFMAIAAKMLGRVANHIQRIGLFMTEHDHGLILLSGPMRAGKSTTLITVIDALRDVPTLRVKPLRDDRQGGLKTHTGIEAQAFNITTAAELFALVKEHQPRVVIVDEAQFFEPEVAHAILEIAETLIVIVATLDLTFEPQPWPSYTTLARKGPHALLGAFLHLKLIGVCQKCSNKRATRSMLIVEPPKEGTVLTGAKEYLTVCKACHAPPPS